MSAKPDNSDPPPPFQEYIPKFRQNSDGHTISHDSHLNKDGEALYRFILSQADIPPAYLLSIHGSHTEQRTRVVTRTQNGSTVQRTERYTVTVTDFEFSIDLTDNLVTGPVQWSYPDSEPTYRGLMVKQTMSPAGRVKATKELINTYGDAKYARNTNGLPPWVSPDGTHTLQPEQSSMSMRQWADDYASSPKFLKEFVYKKVIHGWNTEKLKAAIHSAILETGYRGHTVVLFNVGSSKVYIRSDNALSRILSHSAYKFLLSVVLVYPCIWLFKRYHRRGGGRWKAYGSAYALKHIEPLTPEELEEAIPDIRPPSLSPRVVSTEQGPMKLVGLREGEWFKLWEPTIKRCVAIGLKGSDTLVDPRQVADPALNLDGYTPDPNSL